MLGTHIIFILSRIAGELFSGLTGRRIFSLSSCKFLYRLKVVHWKVGDHASRECECPPSSKPEIDFRECYLCVCLSLCFHDYLGVGDIP